MSSKKRSLQACRLCVIVNRPFFKNSAELVRTVKNIVSRTDCLIQLRDKNSAKKDILAAAVALSESLKGTGSLFIVNDHADIAVLSEADGAHLGQSDLPLKAARKLIGRDKIIGISCLDLRQALSAVKEGADYLGVGPVFPTSTKIDSPVVGLKLVEAVVKKVKVPVYAIGGIDKNNIHKVLALGCGAVAVSSAICCADDPARSALEFSDILNS